MANLSPENEPASNPQHPDFVAEYEHTDRITTITYSAPFPTAVFGINKEFFGVGKVVGNINDNPVIEVLDRDSGDPYHVMGYESWWCTPIPDEVIDGMASGALIIDSVASYRQAQDDHWATEEIADNTFLGDLGIDPESL